MTKVRLSKTNNKWKRSLWILAAITLVSISLYTFFPQSKGNDLQYTLRNLPNEITNAVTINNQQQKILGSEEIIRKFETLIEELNQENERQAKKFEKQHKTLEKKINLLKPISKDSPLSARLATRFPYKPKSKFPAFIWQTSSASMASSSTPSKNSQKWIDKNPGFVYEIVNPSFAEKLIKYYFNNMPEIWETYMKFPKGSSNQMNFVKYLVLLVHGGTYCDKDTIPQQPIPNWIPEATNPKDIGLLISIRDESLNLNDNDPIRKLQFENSIVHAKQHHPIIRDIIINIVYSTLNKENNSKSHTPRFNTHWEELGLWTDVIFKYFNHHLKKISGTTDQVISWQSLKSLKTPRLIGDILIYPAISFNSPTDSNDRDPLYLASHAITKRQLLQDSHH
ncbi:uncharacterized protein NDAI_0C02540 [Naumovozyma dairenensis CBS 421]|uniref:Alpha-1,6-mannosyltransferase n=1 Tax=Naumovozyma dairenensis (strain ATCC 10597 / BCRC 20456 / CBS 421 / NBRC 0211 / NRRL Y-12639) TaxID=1071378 RepID=G0W803_NAUDC|nr:hypothetical protein NDAI_0C02540 [Naumovozyma dairenensis CBS 421]CCD23914.1 hypothetical protein NDAI_0C02540 [Naumovozyma dairenensis CBS 421]